MHFDTPNDKDGPDDPVCESCVLTLVLEKDHTIRYYEGMPGESTIVRQTDFSKDGIRNIILQKRRDVATTRGKAS